MFENLAFLKKKLIILIIVIKKYKKELQGRLLLGKREAKLGRIEVLGPDYKSVEAVYSRT